MGVQKKMNPNSIFLWLSLFTDKRPDYRIASDINRLKFVSQRHACRKQFPKDRDSPPTREKAKRGANLKVKKSDKKDSNAKRNHSKDHNLLRENIASVPSNKINYNLF